MKKILVIDDDAELRETLASILCEAGYEIDEAASSDEALEKVTAGDYDVALLDMIMPGRDGIDILGDMRKVHPRTRVIMITAFATIENAVAAIKKGASDYISKPFKINELLTTVKRVIEETKFEASLRKLNIEDTLSSLSNPIRRDIILLLKSRQRMRLMELTRELEIEDHTKVLFHLKLLKATGIIEQDREKQYSLTREGYRAMDLLNFLGNYLND